MIAALDDFADPLPPALAGELDVVGRRHTAELLALKLRQVEEMCEIFTRHGATSEYWATWRGVYRAEMRRLTADRHLPRKAFDGTAQR